MGRGGKGNPSGTSAATLTEKCQGNPPPSWEEAQSYSPRSKMGARKPPVRRAGFLETCLEQQHNWPDMAPSWRPCPSVPPSASLTFLSNTHSSLAPASPGASGAGSAGTFFPWEQSEREGRGKELTQPGGDPCPAAPLSLLCPAPTFCPPCSPPCQVSPCAPSRWPAVGRIHAGYGGVRSRSQHSLVPTTHFTGGKVEDGSTVPV